MAHGMHKGSMALIEEERAETIYQAMGPAVESSGGSAANTIVGVASFGGHAAFSARSRTMSLAAPSRMTSAPPASPSTQGLRATVRRPRAATSW